MRFKKGSDPIAVLRVLYVLPWRVERPQIPTLRNRWYGQPFANRLEFHLIGAGLSLYRHQFGTCFCNSAILFGVRR
jgi:hypothetical protein